MKQSRFMEKSSFIDDSDTSSSGRGPTILGSVQRTPKYIENMTVNLGISQIHFCNDFTKYYKYYKVLNDSDTNWQSCS